MSLNVTIKTVGNLEHGPKIRCVSSRRVACTIHSEARDQAIAKVWVGRPRKEGLSCWLAGTRHPPGHCELCVERRRRGSRGLSEYAMIHEIPVNFRHPPHPGQYCTRRTTAPNSCSSSTGLFLQSWLDSSRAHTKPNEREFSGAISEVQRPSDVPCRSGTSGSSKENVASQIRFFYLVPPSSAPIHRAMSTPGNNTSQNQTSIQGVGTTGTPLLAPARTQKDGVIGNSTVGTFGVCCLLASLLQALTIKVTGQVRIGPNAQGLGRRSSAECWILTDVMFRVV